MRGPNAHPALSGCANDLMMSRREKKGEKRRVVLRCGDGKRTEPFLPNPNDVHIGSYIGYIFIHCPDPQRSQRRGNWMAGHVGTDALQAERTGGESK